jgi:antitoxin component of MazEF toxin-antitoxin module
MDAAEKLKENRLDVKTRRIQRIGNSLYVALPPEFTKRMQLEPGEEVVVVAKGETVRVMPVKEI